MAIARSDFRYQQTRGVICSLSGSYVFLINEASRNKLAKTLKPIREVEVFRESRNANIGENIFG